MDKATRNAIAFRLECEYPWVSQDAVRGVLAGLSGGGYHDTLDQARKRLAALCRKPLLREVARAARECRSVGFDRTRGGNSIGDAAFDEYLYQKRQRAYELACLIAGDNPGDELAVARVRPLAERINEILYRRIEAGARLARAAGYGRG